MKNASPLYRFGAMLFFGAALVVSCRSHSETDPVDAQEELSGGMEGTVFDATFNAFGNAFANLTSDETDRFVIGNSFNRSNWVVAPSSTTARDGLGPLMNASSCSSCHNLDGRSDPYDNGQPSQPLLFRLSIAGKGPHGEPVDEPSYGGQFNPRAIPNATAEGDVLVSFEEVPGTYADGTAYSLRRPVFRFANLNYGAMASGTMVSPRVAPPMHGMGLLENVPDATLLALADPNDTDKDGISGRVNTVWNAANARMTVGRIGWKANQPSVRQQVASAFAGDIGITSSLVPTENLTARQQEQYHDLPNGGTPEISDTNLDAVIFYVQTLAVPARRNWTDATVRQGKTLFRQAGCTGCHKPELQTGTGHTVSYLNNQKIRPYTDLLLHDMGDDLADHRPDFDASGSEWRTPPLWGIGLVKVVNKHTQFLHDGRARNTEEAILWHGGEGAAARDAFRKLSKNERQALLAFLDSL